MLNSRDSSKNADEEWHGVYKQRSKGTTSATIENNLLLGACKWTRDYRRRTLVERFPWNTVRNTDAGGPKHRALGARQPSRAKK